MTDSMINQDIATYEGDRDQLAISPIKMCDGHQMRLVGLLEAAGRPDLSLSVSHALFTLAAKTVGTDVLCEFRCPICTFETFDFMQALVDVMTTPTAPQPASQLILS